VVLRENPLNANRLRREYAMRIINQMPHSDGIPGVTEDR
jgi:hypothetical protein